MNNSVKTRPQRRITQAELDAFLEKAADLLRGGVDHSDLLIANTTLRLNIPLLGYKDNDWTEDTIKQRGEKLADAALRVWPGPQSENFKT